MKAFFEPLLFDAHDVVDGLNLAFGRPGGRLPNFAMIRLGPAAHDVGDVEGFGIALIEANALGLPGIGSTNCGIEDAISDKKSGILVPYNNSELFISALNTILTEYDNYKSNAKTWALQHSWESIIEKYIKEII